MAVTFWWLEPPASLRLLAEWDHDKMKDAFEIIRCPARAEHQRPGRRLLELNIVLPDVHVQNFVWTWQSECLVTNDTLEWLRANGFTGFKVRPVHARFRKSTASPPVLWELVITGWSGMAKPESGIELDEAKSCPACGYRKYTGLKFPRNLVDPKKWDGSDFFIVWPLPKFIFVSDRVASAILDSGITGIHAQLVSEMENTNGYTPGRLQYHMPEDRAQQLGKSLGIY